VSYILSSNKRKVRAAEKSVEKEREREQENRAERKKAFVIFVFLIHPAENLRFPEIERSDRLDILAAPSQQLDERFGRLDRGFEVWRSGFHAVLHSSVLVIYFLSLCYFDSIHLDVLISKCMMILYASSII
jgi:hypothetical protein